MKLQYLAVLFLLGALWGSSFMFIKIAGAEMPPEGLVAARLILGATVLLAVLYGSGQRLPTGWRIWRDFAVTGIIGLILPFTLITWGELSIPSSMAAILNGTTPLFSLLIAYFWLRNEQMTGLRLLGVLLGFVGVLIAVGVEQVALGGVGVQAQLAVLLAAAFYGLSGVYARKAFQGLPALVPATGQLLSGAVLLTPVALLRHGLPSRLPSLPAIAALVALAVVGTAIAYILLYWLIERVGSTRASMVTYLIAPLGLFYGSLFLGEHVAPSAIFGLGLVVIGILLANNVLRLRPAVAAKA